MKIEGKIPAAHLRDVCRMGHGPDTCRYITAGQDGVTCQKGTTLGADIDARVKAGLFVARADNCPGLSIARVAPERADAEAEKPEAGRRPLKSEEEFKAMRIWFQATVLAIMKNVLLQLNPAQIPAFLSLSACDVSAGLSRVLVEWFEAEDEAGEAAIRRHVAEAVKFTLENEPEALQSSFSVLCAHFGHPMGGPAAADVAKRRKG